MRPLFFQVCRTTREVQRGVVCFPTFSSSLSRSVPDAGNSQPPTVGVFVRTPGYEHGSSLFRQILILTSGTAISISANFASVATTFHLSFFFQITVLCVCREQGTTTL